MKRYFIHHPVFRIVAPLIYGVLVYLLVLMINNAVGQINDLFNSMELYVCIGLTYVSFESIRILIVLLTKYNAGKSHALHLAIQFVTTTFISVGIIMIILSAYFERVIGFGMTDTQFMIFTGIYSITGLIYNLLYLSDYYLQKENTLKLQAETQHKEILEMEMAEFQHDINPELLYESLENLIGIMYRDVDKADDYIDSLASAYRYVLTNRAHELIEVRDEIDAGKNLIQLLNEKYFGQLQFESTIDVEDLDRKLIPGSLPLLLESIVRNSIVTRFESFTIACYIEDDYLVIQSKLNDRLTTYPGSDLAFARLQKSYSLYTDLPLIKVKAYQENYVKLPILQVEEYITAHG
jgi:sensor histidine kinase YesM